MVQFKAITDENFMELIEMKLTENFCFDTDFNYITNALALAWLNRDKNNTFPFAIYQEETLVGFMMLHDEPDERNLHLWYLMMAIEHRGHGYGTQAVELLIRLAGDAGKYDSISLDCSPGKKAAIHIYEKLGFQPTGESSCGMDAYRLDLK